MGSRLASPFSFSHVDVGDAFQFINDISQRRTNRSAWGRGKAQAFKAIGRGFTPRQRFVFFTRRRRRRVSIYQSYIGGLPPASALSFSHVYVGNAFQFITPTDSFSIYQSYNGGLKKRKGWRGANPRPMDKGYDRQHIPLCNQSYTCLFQAQRLPYKLE